MPIHSPDLADSYQKQEGAWLNRYAVSSLVHSREYESKTEMVMGDDPRVQTVQPLQTESS